MSRRLFLLRHAKSSWNDSGLDDFDRPLNKRGREAAPAMGKVMAEEGWEPDYVFCSSAKRTQQTLDRVLAKLDGDPEIIVADDLYLASAPTSLNASAAHRKMWKIFSSLATTPASKSWQTN